MSSRNSTEHLPVNSLERYAVKIRCTHNEVTLVQHDDPEYGWFACYQCDRCGQITQREVTADDLDKASDTPWLDIAMYEQNAEVSMERLLGNNLGKTLAFFGKAMK